MSGRYDHPVVYCLSTFCQLTGYSEHEVLGRNCCFLQAPGGQVEKGELRTNTSSDAIVHLRKSLVADKECQTSYEEDRDAVVNLVKVPTNEEGEVVYHVGFQVMNNQRQPTTNARDRKQNAIPPVMISKELKHMLADPKFRLFIHVVLLKGSFLYVGRVCGGCLGTRWRRWWACQL